MSKNIDEIKKNIHTINPQITDEVLDLLYEYIVTRKSNEDFQSIQAAQLDIKGIIKSIILNN